MPNGESAARGLTVPRLKRPGRLPTAAHPTQWLPKWSAEAAVRAARATVVVPGMFAFADEVVGNLQMATFAAFGGFATLVMVSFGGTRRDKLLAHAALAVAGSVLLTIGTAVASSTALAAIVTVPVAFAVFFAGVAGPNAASGITGALLAYVLPAASPGAISMIPDRLAGWWLASVTGTTAVLLFSVRPAGERLPAAASKLASALADAIAAALRGDATQDSLNACLDAKRELVAVFTATPYRPTGLTTPDQALANAVEVLEWCTALVADCARDRTDLRDAHPVERELLEAASDALREVGSLLAGREGRPDLDQLERRRARSAARLGQLTPDGNRFPEAVELSFHAQTIAVAAGSIAADCLIASRLADPETIAAQRRRWFGESEEDTDGARRLAGVAGAAAVAVRHASLRSVWFINSARGALSLAVAVAVADLSSVQHGFWVVLGALSVLRTNAASTGSTALRALGGTVAGFVIGAALLLAIGSDTTALWIALPIAVCVAAYAPGTAPFAVGQAGFTLVVAVLFNLLVPVGWKVGVVRIEDVAIGCAVSVAVGGLFWPRGVSAVVGDDLADAFRSGASYLTQAVDWALGLRARAPDTAVAAATAGIRLDDALRGFLAEQGAKRIEKEKLWRLVGGSLRLRLTAYAVAGLPHGAAGAEQACDALDRRAQVLAAFYERLAMRVGRPRRRALPSLDPPTEDHRSTETDGAGSHQASYVIWVRQQLHDLSQHLGELVEPATHIAQIRRRPWWR